MKKIMNFSTLIIILTMMGCTKDLIVKDIKTATININAPSDSLKTPYNAITFWWDEVDGADKYNLQIVKPNFNSIQQLIVDTNVTSNKFSHTFTPGIYQWRVKAFNSAGGTAYITHTFTIDSTSNLSYVSVGLISPATKSVTSHDTITFFWNTLPYATSYELIVSNITGSITSIPNLTGTNYDIHFSTAIGTEEKYTWQVKAFNSTQTLINTIRSFKIDHKSPLSPSINYPNTYGVTFGDTTYLKWSSNPSSTDIKYDIISINTDSTFNTFGIYSGSVTATSTTSVQIKSIVTYSGTPTKFWWQIISVDSVGNHSVPTLSKRFNLK